MIHSISLLIVTLLTATNVFSSDVPASTMAKTPINYVETLTTQGLITIPIVTAKGKVDDLFGFARSEPYSFFKSLRQNAPLLKLEGSGLVGKTIIPDIFVVSRYDDVVETLERNTEFQVIPNRANMNNSVGPYMLAYEEKETIRFNETSEEHPGVITPHQRGLKAESEFQIDFRAEKEHMWDLVNRPEDRQRIIDISMDTARAGLKKGMKSGAELDVVQYISRDVPIMVVMNYFGIKPTGNVEVDKRLLSFWSRWTQNSFFHNSDRRDDVNAMASYAMRGKDRFQKEFGSRKPLLVPYSGEPVPSFYDQGMNFYVQKLIKQRRVFLSGLGLSYEEISKLGTKSYGMYYAATKPSQRSTIDLMLLAGPMHESAGINEERLIANVMGLLVGAVETGSAAMVQSLQVILNNDKIKNLAAQAVANDDFDEFSKIVWEALRFDPINPWVARVAAQDSELLGSPVKKGSVILISTESAMMDESKFPEPELFKTNRPKEDYLHMGSARHQCLGYDVAYDFVPAGLWVLFKKSPNLKPAGNKGIDFVHPEQTEKDFRNPFPESYLISF